MMPGWMMFAAHVLARELDGDRPGERDEPPLAAVYESCATVKPASAETEPTLMIDRRPTDRCGSRASHEDGPFRLIACTRSQSASLCRGPTCLVFQSTPALL